jgi:hypothetical protein
MRVDDEFLDSDKRFIKTNQYTRMIRKMMKI